MGTWRTAVSHLSWGLLAAITCTALLLEGSASAQFAPSGGALLHSRRSGETASSGGRGHRAACRHDGRG